MNDVDRPPTSTTSRPASLVSLSFVLGLVLVGTVVRLIVCAIRGDVGHTATRASPAASSSATEAGSASAAPSSAIVSAPCGKSGASVSTSAFEDASSLVELTALPLEVPLLLAEIAGSVAGPRAAVLAESTLIGPEVTDLLLGIGCRRSGWLTGGWRGAPCRLPHGVEAVRHLRASSGDAFGQGISSGPKQV